MSIRNEIESFIEGIYSDCSGRLSRAAIVLLAHEAFIAPTVADLFRLLPPADYDKEGFVTAINSLIKERKLEDITGGLVRILTKR